MSRNQPLPAAGPARGDPTPAGRRRQPGLGAEEHDGRFRRNGELRIDDAALAASLLLGLLVQPALFVVYGGLDAPLVQ